MRRWKVYKGKDININHLASIKQPYIDFLNMKMDVLYWKALNNQNDNIISDWDSYLDYLEEGDSLMERWISWSYR